MSAVLTIARRELRSGVRGFWVFLLCLMLGVATIAAVGLVRAAITQALGDQGAALLGGDAQYAFTYRRATPEEYDWIDTRANAVSETIEFRSMLRRGTGADLETALTQVKAVDDRYPLVGALTLDPPVDVAALAPGEQGDPHPGAFVDPVLADRLGLKVGDLFDLGDTTFQMRARLLRQPDDTGVGLSLGPPTLVARDAIEGSGFLAPGALYESEYRVLLPEDTDLDALRASADEAFAQSGMRWTDRRRASPAAERFVTRLGSFLVLVGLAGLAVGGVGISATVSAWLERKADTIATLRALGATGRMIRWIFLLQLGGLIVLGVGLGLALAIVSVWAGAGVLADILPVAVDLHPRAMPLLEAAIFGSLVAAIFALWPLSRLSGLKVARLYRDADAGGGRPGLVALLVIAALVVLLFGAAVAFSGLPKLTLGALAGVAFALGCLALIGRLVRRLARIWAKHARGRPMFRLALAAIGGPRSEALPVILSLGLGLSVLSAVGQIDAGLRGAIATDLPKQAPAYFVIDIQPDQLRPFEDQLARTPQVSKVETTPMLRGVITQINGRPARENHPDHWVLRGDRGVTYSSTPREAITQGSYWPRDYTGPPQISFAAQEAAELGLKIGDTLTVNILGRDITAPITSFRDVDFSTGGIGFVVTFNPSALQAAPHTNLATIYAPPEAEAQILRDLARNFPNITAIRVRDAVNRLSEALGAIARATSLAAGVTLLTGFVVLIGAAAAGERERAWEAALLKTLGAGRVAILLSFAGRSALLGMAAGLMAVGFGAAASWAVLSAVMDLSFRFDWSVAFAIVGGGILATLGAGLVFAWRPLAARPAAVLRARD
ncbi:FtsX-like permease family protein [Rhodobacteraceae bacterium]|nr:FtsX-like permease family protein [Paracoccaceae bacterium]